MNEYKYTITDKISKLWGIKSQTEKLFNKLSIYTIKDLVYFFPSKYIDTSNVLNISQFLTQGEGTLMLEIRSKRQFYTPKKRMIVIEATGADNNGFINIKWFNQRYILNSLEIGKKYLVYGKLTNSYGQYFISNPEIEQIKSDDIDKLVHLGRITPIYPETRGVSSKRIRSILFQLKEFIQNYTYESLPSKIMNNNKLISLNEALYKIHFPDTLEDIEKARERLGFEELYNIQKKVYLLKKQQLKLKSFEISSLKSQDVLLKNFGYDLTNSQKEATKEILKDLSQTTPMHRILIGDVGTGKTIVALFAAISAVENGYNAVLMAPTTILAQQHYNTITKLLKGINIETNLVLSSNKKDINTKNNGIYVGTHALLYHKEITNIGVLIIDEQHRFGVKQRSILANTNTNGFFPHYLIMSATPIPRTLALSIYGNLDISYLTDMPYGDKSIKTYLINSVQKDNVYLKIRDKIIESRNTEIEQAFIICPLINESEVLQSRAAIKTFEELENNIYKDMKVALIHGQMKDEEKQKILKDFAELKYEILVSTPVIEVGIDIPNAKYMIIESADRFGLAQLHQLRGRIGRRSQKSYCFVCYEGESSKVTKRLEYFSTHFNGLDVAEFDMKTRGPGEIYGVKQSGIPELKIASLFDSTLMKKARDAAFNNC